MFIFSHLLVFSTCWFLLMQIFRFSTYHRYFKKSLIVIIGLGTLDGYLLVRLHWSSVFVWYMGFFAVLLCNKYYNEKKKIVVAEAFDGALKEQMKLSMGKTLRYYVLSSLVFLISFSAAFSICCLSFGESPFSDLVSMDNIAFLKFFSLATGVTGGLVSISYQGVAEKKGWAIQNWFYTKPLSLYILISFLIMCSAILMTFKLYFWWQSILLIVFSYFFSAVVTFSLKSRAQYLSILLITASVLLYLFSFSTL